MTTVERLFAKLRAAGVEIPDGAEFRRTYAGARQCEAGAWSWFIWTPGEPCQYDGHRITNEIGSHWRAADIVRAPSITITREPGGWSVDPAEMIQTT